MIETKQAVTVKAPIDAVWTHASDISRWAKIMPGYRECELIDADTSRWVLKVGVGGMVRTVTVLVNVLEWAGPDRVAFIFELIGDPVQGGGTYLARSNADGQTELELHIQPHFTGISD